MCEPGLDWCGAGLSGLLVPPPLAAAAKAARSPSCFMGFMSQEKESTAWANAQARRRQCPNHPN